MTSVSDKKILVINSASDVRAQIHANLEMKGFNCIDEAADALSAIRKLSQASYDLIITDIHLTQLDAWQLIRLVRSKMLEANPHTKILVLSSTYTQNITDATAKALGADGSAHTDQLEQLGEITANLVSSQEDTASKPSILVITSDTIQAETITGALQSQFTLTHVKNEKTALKIFLQKNLDLILLDEKLVGTSSQQLLTQLLTKKPQQSILILGANNSASNAKEMILAGAIDYLNAPIQPELLIQRCNVALRREYFFISQEQFQEKEVALTAAKNRALITLNSITDGVITTDKNCIVDYINPVALEILECTQEEILGKQLNEYYRTYHSTSYIPTVDLTKRAITKNEIQRSASITSLKSRGKIAHSIEQQAAPIIGENGENIGAVLVFRDCTEVEVIEKRLSFHASHDLQTGLKNRDTFEHEVRLAIDDSTSHGTEHCLCHISLAQFDIVAESYGHKIGDQLLRQVATILQQKVRAPSDVIARIEGYEFGILLRHCSIEAAERICGLITANFTSTEFKYDDKSFEISAGVGIVAVNGEVAEISSLLSAAIAASNTAKERGKNKTAIFSGDDTEIVEKHSAILYANQLMEAIEADRIMLYQQRIASGNSDQNDSYEILSRIKKEDGEIALPTLYLNAAERYALTPRLDKWVIQKTLSWLEENPVSMEKLEYMSINLSGLSICDDTFTDFIEQSFQNSDIPPNKVCFEITETAAVSNFLRASDFITAIRDLGCRFALDDFGAGMSSFAYLKKLPIDILKIDGLFIRDILSDPIDFEMVKSINDIGHAMGLKTVAEYVENEEILAALKSLGVDAFQGYGVAKPAPISQLEIDADSNSASKE
jgi:diguanylate cyclase (GGDEF)-like protein/PAS domain S-box-containing protein